MSQFGFGSLLFLGGLLMIRFRKPIARFVVHEQNEMWGFKFGQSQIRASEIVIIVAGTAAVAIGVLIGMRLVDFSRP